MENSNDVGLILRREREQRGLTLEVIQEATKIPIDSLKAIEEGYKIRTLTSFYYKSFVRLYAQHLGVDPLPILALIPSYQPVVKASLERLKPALKPAVKSEPRLEVKSESKPAVIPVENPVVKSTAQPVAKPDMRKLNMIAGPIKVPNWKKALPVVLGIAVIVIVGAGIVIFGKALLKKFPVKWTMAAPVKAGENSKNVKQNKGERSPKVEKSEKTIKADKIEKPVKEAKPVKESKPAVSEQPLIISAPIPPAKSVEEITAVRRTSLTVRATVTAWLTVRCDGAVVFKGSLKKGSSESWKAVKKIEISGKEVDGLEFEVNGKTIGKLSRRDTRPRKVVVTPEGLLVEK